MILNAVLETGEPARKATQTLRFPPFGIEWVNSPDAGQNGLAHLRLLLTQHFFAFAAGRFLSRGACLRSGRSRASVWPRAETKLSCKLVAPSRRVAKLQVDYLLRRLTQRGSHPLQKMSRQLRQSERLRPDAKLYLRCSHLQMSLRKGSSDGKLTVIRRDTALVPFRGQKPGHNVFSSSK